MLFQFRKVQSLMVQMAGDWGADCWPSIGCRGRVCDHKNSPRCSRACVEICIAKHDDFIVLVSVQFRSSILDGTAQSCSVILWSVTLCVLPFFFVFSLRPLL